MNVSIGRIELSRVPVSVMAFIIIMSIAPVFIEAMFPWVDATDHYYTLKATNGAVDYFKGLAQEGGILGDLGMIGWGAVMALRGLLMIVENLLTGGYPVWKMIGLDVTFENGFNLALALAAFMDILLGIMLYKALQGGLRI